MKIVQISRILHTQVSAWQDLDNYFSSFLFYFFLHRCSLKIVRLKGIAEVGIKNATC